MIRIRCRHRSGFEILVDVATLEAVDPQITELQRLGYRPPGNGDGWQRTPTGEPRCPQHGAVLTLREKQGDHWHSHRVVHPVTGEELWCRGYPTGKADDGYSVPGPSVPGH